MEIRKLHIALMFLFTLSLVFSQEEPQDHSKFSFSLNANSGQAKVENDNLPNYNLDVNTIELLLNYSFNNHIGIAIGIGYNDLTGNGFNNVGDFYHERQTLRFPVLLTTERHFERIVLQANVGLYGQVVIDDEYQYLFFRTDEVFNGWTFGFQGNINLMYQLTDRFALGVNLTTQSDFSKLDSGINEIVNDEQRITQQNTFGLVMNLKL